ncbi:MAG: methyltransferase domain-containing protein [Patescibacteria group bacterium]
MNKDTSWGSVAGWYDDLLENGEGTYQKEVILPNLLRLVAPQKGDMIIEIACGQGYFARAFAEKGAEVTGADIAQELITFAQKNSPASIQYHATPADKLGFAQNASFNKAVIVLALQNIERLQETLAEAARVLKPGARLHIVLNHPAFRIPGNSSWAWDEASSKQYRRLDGYMSEKTSEIDMTPGEKDSTKKKTTVSFHRPLQVYFKACTKAGFAVTRLEEWISHKKSQTGARSAEEDRMRKEIPMFLYVEVQKKP